MLVNEVGRVTYLSVDILSQLMLTLRIGILSVKLSVVRKFYR